MKSIITRSLFLVLISFVIILSIFFLNSNFFTPYQFLNSVNYLIYENFGLVIFLSQFLYVQFNKKLNRVDIIINTVVCTIIFNLIRNFYPDYNDIVLNITESDIIHVKRAVIDQFELRNVEFIQTLLRTAHNWDLTVYPLLSSFSILCFNISLLALIMKKFPNYVLLRSITFISIFLFILYFWDYSINSVLLLLSFIFIGVGAKLEVR